VPLLMTMEMWQLGGSMDRLRLALFVALSLPVLFGLSYYAGFERTVTRKEDLADTLVAFGVGLRRALAPGPARTWAPRLVAAYGLNEGAGIAAADGSGNGRTGTLAGGASWTTGRFGGGLSLDGVSGRVELPALGTFYDGGFTLEAWVKPRTAKTDVAVLGSWVGGENGGPMIWVDHVTGRYRLTFNRGSVDDYLVNALLVNSSTSFQLKYLNARIVSNVAQLSTPDPPTTPPAVAKPPIKLVHIKNISGHAHIGPVRADITNSPAGTIGICQDGGAGTTIISAMPQLTGFTTDIVPYGDHHSGFGLGGSLVMPDIQGLRSCTTGGADDKSIVLCGGGAFGDSRGAYISLSGNNHFTNGRLDLRAGFVANAHISFQAVGEEVAKLVGQDVMPEGGTALLIRRRQGGAYSLQQVSMGADDSGGSGFKVLRVPNLDA